MRTARRVLVLLTALLAFGGVMALPAGASGDDYPWRTDSTWTADRWGFTKRQCVSFVAWRLAQRNQPVSNYTQHWGSALDWDNTSRRLGVGIGSRPVVGAVAQWNAYESSTYYGSVSTVPIGTMKAGPSGHVGYVQGVHSDGSAVVAQYNMTGNRSYSLVRVKAPRYLYIGVAAPR